MNNDEAKFNRWIMEAMGLADTMRVENLVGSGTPDINVCKDGREVWIESKMVLPAGVLLRKEQYAWGTRRARNGGRAFVVAKALDKGLIWVWRHPIKGVSKCGRYLRIDEEPHAIVVSQEALVNLIFETLRFT